MGDKLTYERFLWFHGRVRAGTYPNARNLADKFEISGRTAQRDIEFMRDRLNAPLEYDHGRKGYLYSESYDLPSLWFSEDLILAFSLAIRLASSIPDTETKRKLLELLERIVNSHSSDRVSLQDLSEKVSVKNIEYSRVNENWFALIVNAIFNKKALAITYYSPHSKKETCRAILPLHLIQYMGSWHVIAYCDLRKGLRDFALSRIKSAAQSEEEILCPQDLPEIKNYTRKHFGILQGGRTKKVCLRFSAEISDWIQEQVWHADQEMKIEADGSVGLTFPVADYRELKRRILSYGPDVKVISPKSLAEEIRQEIEKMSTIY